MTCTGWVARGAGGGGGGAGIAGGVARSVVDGPVCSMSAA
jgi:hypothetical protein